MVCFLFSYLFNIVFRGFFFLSDECSFIHTNRIRSKYRTTCLKESFWFIVFGSDTDIVMCLIAFMLKRGRDIESLDVLRQGFTHAFLMTFNKKEDFAVFQSHPNHVEFSTTFSAAIENIVLLDFPSTLVKAPA